MLVALLSRSSERLRRACRPGHRGRDPSQLWALVALIVLLGALLRFYGLDREPLWSDEAATLRYAEMPQAWLWRDSFDTSPPLYYSLERIWLAFGRSEVALRSLPAAIGTATIPLIYMLGRTLAGPCGGLASALLLATSALHVQFSQEARTYTLLLAAATLAVWGLVRLLDEPPAAADLSPAARSASRTSSMRATTAYVVGTIVALYAHNLAIFLPFIANLVVCLYWAVHRRFDRAFLSRWLLANLVVAGAWSWWLPVVLQQFGSDLYDLWWLPAPSLTQALGDVIKVYGQVHFYWRWRPYVSDAFMGLGLLGFCILARRKPWPAAALGGVVVLTPALAWAVSILSLPIFYLRPILWPLPMFLSLVATGIVGPPWRMLVGGAVLAVALTIQAVALVNLYTHPTRYEPWDAIVRRVGAGGDARSISVLLCGADAEMSFGYYAERANLEVPIYGVVAAHEPTWRRPLLRQPIGRGATIAPTELASFAASFQKVWLVERLCEASSQIRRELAPRYREVSSEWMGSLKMTVFSRER
jgi:4-amino-4-deoxy-L-arabinose transferase-like glycosyltransferase